MRTAGWPFYVMFPSQHASVGIQAVNRSGGVGEERHCDVAYGRDGYCCSHFGASIKRPVSASGVEISFSIVVERAAKFALANGRKLRVMPERGCPADERRIRQYFGELRQSGAPFNSQTSSLYSPLGPEKFRDTLYELRFKRKSSPMAQIADLYLWPIAIAGYDRGNRAYNLLKSAGRLIESHISETQWDERATKYSCFELVRRHERGS